MSTTNGEKKKIGRPRVDSEAVYVRLERAALDALDGWRASQPDHPGRPEAIRRLIAFGLEASRGARESGK
jgi:hypothetical protein